MTAPSAANEPSSRDTFPDGPDRPGVCRAGDHRLSRRAWLGGVGGAALSTALPLGIGAGGLLAPSAALGEALRRNEKQVLFIWLDGGISQFESWDPKPHSEFGGPFRPISTRLPGVQLSELMPQTARWMHKLAVVRSMSTQDNSHSAGVARIQRGDPKNRGVVYPYFGSAVANLLGGGSSGLPPYVWIKPGSSGFIDGDGGFLGPKFGAVAFGDGKPPENLLRPAELPEARAARRLELRRQADARYAAGRVPTNVEANSQVFDSADALLKRRELFDLEAAPARDRDRYGRHEFGRHLLLARRMIEAGVRFVKVASYGWDTHGDNFNGHASLVPKVDQAFAALIEDLSDRGMLERVLVVCLSEFGRTPRINGHLGRDHYPEAWSLAMAGAGLKPGVVEGETDARGVFVKSRPYDIGHLFHTWFTALGIDSKDEYDHHGQPLPIAHDDCFPVKELLL